MPNKILAIFIILSAGLILNFGFLTMLQHGHFQCPISFFKGNDCLVFNGLTAFLHHIQGLRGISFIVFVSIFIFAAALLLFWLVSKRDLVFSAQNLSPLFVRHFPEITNSSFLKLSRWLSRLNKTGIHLNS